MKSRRLAARSHRNTASSRNALSIQRIVHTNDSSGSLHVLAQDMVSAECWYFAENEYGELWLEGSIGKPDGGKAGAITLIEDPNGYLLAFAVGVNGSAWMNRRSKSKWNGWVRLGNSAITHFAAVRQERGVLLVARTNRGHIDALSIDDPIKFSTVWSHIGKSCAGQPQVLLGSLGEVLVLFRSDSGELLEMRQIMGVFGQPQHIESQTLTGDPCVALSQSGQVYVAAASRRGLIVKKTDGGAWQDASAFLGSPVKAREPRFFMVERSLVLLTARNAIGNLLTKTSLTSWNDTGVREPDVSSLVRFKSGKIELLKPSWLIAVIDNGKWSAFTIAIQTTTPASPLFEGDELVVTCTLTNSSPKPATGDTTASVSSNSPTWYSFDLKLSGPSAAGLAPGSSMQSSFKLDNYLAPGVAHISVRYVSYQTPPKLVRMSFYGPGLGPVVALGGVIDYIAADTREEKVWQFDEWFPTDDLPVVPGPPQCSAGSPDLTAAVHSYNFLTLCRTVQALEKPRTINEAAAIVSAAVAAGTRLRVIGSEHSANAQLCTEGRVIQTTDLQGAAPENSGISLLWQSTVDRDADLSWPSGAPAPLNPPRLVQFENDMTVQVGPGMKIRDLNNWLDANGWSLGFAVPGFREPTIGGAIATGTHGSSTLHSVVISSRVKWLLLIRPDGVVVEYSESNTDSDTWKALRCNLGFLGVAVQIRLKVEPAFNLRVKIQWTTADTLLNAVKPQDLVVGCDYGQMVWFPRGGDADAPVLIFRGHRT
jgi:FAD binding domain